MTAPKSTSKTPELNSFERKPGLESQAITPDNPTQDVDHSLTKTQGIALSDVRGIETEPPTGDVKRALSNEQFMAEWVEIQLAEPGSEDEHQFAEITVNGDRVCIRRGDSAKIRRYHLAVLAAAKQQRLVQKKITNPDGSMGYQESFVLRPVYPFSVLSDSNRAGSTWLRQLLQSAA